MNELVMSTQYLEDFEKAREELKVLKNEKAKKLEQEKRELKKFEQEKEEELKISHVQTEGGFLGLGEHKVTGMELNSRLAAIQTHLQDLNNAIISVIKKTSTIFNYIGSLDNEYVQAILISIKAAEETSKGIANTQKQIRGMVTDQGRTIRSLRNFQEQLSKYEHLKHIDELWNDFQEINQKITKIPDEITKLPDKVNDIMNEVAKLSDEINDITDNIKENKNDIVDVNGKLKIIDSIVTDLENDFKNDIVDVNDSLEIIDNIVTDLGNDLNNQIEKFNTVFEFTEEIRKIVHLKNIDEMWESLVDTRISLNKVRGDLGTVRNDVQSLLDFKAEMAGYEHLNDIDDIWDKTEKHSDEIKSLDAKYDDTDKRLSDAQNHIDSLEKYIQKLRNIAHLNDVDKLWESNNMHSGQISELHRQGEEMSALIYSNKELVDSYIAKIEEKNESVMQTLTKKIKYSYLIAGSAVCLAVIELIIILLR